MKQFEVSATVPKKEGEKGREEDKSAAIYVNYPETLEEAKTAIGEEAILTNAFANWRVTLQAGIRRAILAGKTQEQIQAEFKDAKMGVAVQGAKIDPLQASLAKFKTMSKEEQAAFLKDLRAAAQG